MYLRPLYTKSDNTKILWDVFDETLFLGTVTVFSDGRVMFAVDGPVKSDDFDKVMKLAKSDYHRMDAYLAGDYYE